MSDDESRSKPECHKRAVRARLLIEQAERMLHEANGEVIGVQGHHGHRSRISDEIEGHYGPLQALARSVDFLIRDTTPHPPPDTMPRERREGESMRVIVCKDEDVEMLLAKMNLKERELVDRFAQQDAAHRHVATEVTRGLLYVLVDWLQAQGFKTP